MIGKVKKMDKWVSQELNENHECKRFEISSAHLLCNQNMILFLIELQLVMKSGYCITIIKVQRSGWILTRLQNISQSQNFIKKKVMVTAWCFSAGLFHHSFIKPGETIKVEKYCREIDEMHQKFTSKQPSLVSKKGPILLHDNIRLHVSMINCQKLHMLNYEVLKNPPYSPDLLLTDFYFFKHFDTFLHEKCFRNPKDAETAFNEFVVSRTTTFYDTGIRKHVSRWQKCIEANGSYFNS